MQTQRCKVKGCGAPNKHPHNLCARHAHLVDTHYCYTPHDDWGERHQPLLAEEYNFPVAYGHSMFTRKL